MMLPAVIYLIINNYMPLSGIILAFEEYSVKGGIYGSKLVGFDNFKYLLVTKDAWIITRNTILYNLAFIILGTVFSIFIAVMLNEVPGKRMKKIYQTVTLYPYLISIVVTAYLVNSFLSTETGFINKAILGSFGVENISWYSEPKNWPVIIVVVYLWKNFGYHTILYFSTLIGIDRGYYEAAALDGASRWQQTKYISLPFLKPTIITLTLLSIGRIFYSDFGLFYQVPMNSGALYDVTQTIDTYVYRGLMQLGDIGMSTAAGLYQSVVGFVLVLGANFAVKKISADDALF
ncbi:MAG TPA: sugar ABC transporter permease [Clostridiales bacterium]|nr:sugar ABC transporter permease [Clostridiales bacterium]